MRVPDILRHHGKVSPRKVALVSGERTVTYGELLGVMDRWTSFMRKNGVRKGSKVAVLSHTTPEYVGFLFSTLNAGGVFSPMNIFLRLPELERIASDFSPEFLFVSERFEEVGEELARKIRNLKGVFSADDEGNLRFESYGVSDIDIPGEESRLFADDVAMVVYTGGYGKRQKGAMLTHENLVAASFYSAVELSISREDIYLSTFPLPFLAGTGRLMKFLLAGAKVILMDEFDPERAVDFMIEHRVTHLLLVPQMMSEITEVVRTRKMKIESVKKISYSGIVPVSPLIVEECMSYIPCDFVQSFAQVESTGVISFLHLNEERRKEGFLLSKVLSSVGKESLGLKVSVVDSMGEELPPGVIGELVVEGATVMRGYYNDPLLTGEKLRDGRLHTGYVASVDEEGYIYVVDRMQEIIVRGGIIIDPEEIEEVIMDFGGVREVAVVGSPDEKFGEVPVAMVVPEKEDFSLDGLKGYLEKQLAWFKVPVRLELSSVLPRNSQGKILKAKVKEYLCEE